MCGDHHTTTGRRNLFQPQDEPPDWKTIDLPEPAVLKRLVDAHCHPTDLPFSQEQVRNVGLGGLSAMATRIHDQELVEAYGEEHGVRAGGLDTQGQSIARVVACFGYHPWFCHLLSVNETDKPIDKYDHYASIFIPENLKPDKSGQCHQILREIVVGLPEPVRLKPLLDEMRRRIRKAQSNGYLVMIGEVGLDRSFRVPYLHTTTQTQPPSDLDDADLIREAENIIATAGADEMAQKQALPVLRKTLTPFTTSTSHQLRVLEMQVELAVEFGINISLHSVKAQGETIKFLRDIKKRYGRHFEDRVNVDLHSCGGWSVESWVSESKYFKNLYTSPSLAISARTSVTPHLIRRSDPTRLLVESDTHLIDDTTRRTWAAAVWIAQCRGWTVEQTEKDILTDGLAELGAVARLEHNWKAFMKIR